METTLLVLTVLGFVVSSYALYARLRFLKDPKYRSLCDLSAKMACRKTIMSHYGNLGGLPNGLLGMIFYAVLFFALYDGYYQEAFFLSLGSMLFVSYMAYILIFKLRIICLDCYAIYAINISLLILTGLFYFNLY